MKSLSLLSFLIQCTLFTSFNLLALESQMRITSAYPTTTQNLAVSEVELSYLHDEKAIFSQSSLHWYPVFSVGSLSVADETVLTLGAALGLSYSLTSTLSVFSEAGMMWLNQHEFGQRGVAFKDYGGPWQFQGRVGVGFSVLKSWNIGYAYSHMSNGERYDINPALNTHALYLVYQF